MKILIKYLKAYLIVGFLSFIPNLGDAQDQSIADNLKKTYQENLLVGEEKMELLRSLSFNEITDLDLSIKYAEELIVLSRKNQNKIYLHRGFMQKGNSLRLIGQFKKCLDAFFKAGEVAIEANFLPGVGLSYSSIADTYSEMGNSNNAALYYKKAIDILRETDDAVTLATALINAGDEAFNNEDYDLALEYFEESAQIFKQEDYLIGTAYNLGNVGMVYAAQGKHDLAKTNINEAVDILTELEDYYSISEYLTYMADIYQNQNDYENALIYANRSLKLANTYGLKKQQSESNLLLAELHDSIGNREIAFTYYKEHINYRDQVNNLETVQQAADLRTNFEISQRETQLELAEQRRINQRNILIATAIALVLFLLMAIGLYRRNKFIQRTKKIIEQERDKSDSLLLNILPEETAEELKLNGSVQAKKYESVTVLFSDFKGFTSYSEKLSPEELVKTIGYYFSKFDDIVEKYGLEKIKTIGDAYMCAGGLHSNTEDHAHKMLLAAKEIASFVEETKADDNAKQLTFDIRIGINTGPVVAGVVGKHKFAYDIWGDTVNVAARMESMSEAGKINISEHTYELVKNDWEFEFRGEIEAKNRGALKMYFVKN